MEQKSYSFRSSLNGFHRGDVITFLEKLSASHEAETNALREELRVTREELLCAQVDLDRARESLARTREELEGVRAEHAGGGAAPAPEEPAMTDRELEIYRRAERHEREAKARAGKICADASETVKQAVTQMEARQEKVTSAADALNADLTALQSVISEILGGMNDTCERLARTTPDEPLEA